jgi:hypothetical protein
LVTPLSIFTGIVVSPGPSLYQVCFPATEIDVFLKRSAAFSVINMD